MDRRRTIPAFLLLFLAVAAAAAAQERENKTSSIGGLIWSARKGENELLKVIDTSSDEESSSVAVEDGRADEFAGGFSSMEGMLQWAIGHSDPETLKERAKEAKKISEDGLKKRQLEIKELMEKLKMPSDAELLKIAIADLNNSSISLEDRQRALNELLFLVEPIDNAKDLDKLGGLVAVIRELYNSDSNIRMTSAWILGKASQNNPLVQNQVLAYGALKELIKMVNSGFEEEAVKALYAISALIRNNKVGLALFCSEKGSAMLQNLMTDRSIDIRLRRKAAFLVSDLADYKLQYDENAALPFLGDRDFLKAVVDLLSTSDLDLLEKALLAIRSLLQLTSTEVSDFQDFCDLDAVLERTRESLSNLMQNEDQAEYIKEIEDLRKEVHNIFHMKINRM